MTRRDGVPHRTLLVIVGLILALVSSVRSGDDDGLASVRPSTYRATPGGALALYLVAEDLDLQVDRYRRSLEHLDAERDVSLFVLLSPPEGLTQLEAGQLLDWVDAGGNLLYAPPRQGRDQLLVRLGAVRWRSRSTQRARRVAEPAGWSAQLAAGVADVVTPFTLWLAFDGGSRGDVLLAAEAGASRSLTSKGSRPEDDELLAAVTLDQGAGRILLLSDAAALANGDLGASGLAPLVVRALASLGAGGRILFDEFHHGFDEDSSLLASSWEFLSTTPLGWALLSLLALGLVALASAGVRLGPALPPPRRPGRSSIEHVHALAAAYAAAGEQAVPVRRLLAGFRLSFGTRDEALCQQRLAALVARAPDLANDVATLEAASSGEDTDPVLLAGAIDAVLQRARSAARSSSPPESLRV